MKSSILNYFMAMIAVYRQPGICEQMPVYAGQFSEEDLTRMGNIHSSYQCGRVNCNGSVFNQQSNRIVLNTHHHICCERCSCDLLECVEYTACCPELLNEIAAGVDTGTCIHPQMKPLNLETTPIVHAVIMISYCPSDIESPPEYIDKCENNLKYEDIDTKMPVSVEKETEVVTFQNRYCAYCNQIDDTDLHYWYVKLDCGKGTFDVTVIPVEQIFKEVQASDDCHLYFVHPVEIEESKLEKCGAMVSECNITGQWKTYDPVIEAACHSYYAYFQNIFRNVFCYLCNVGDSTLDIPKCKLSQNAAVTFALVLKNIPTITSGAKTIKTNDDTMCGNDTIYDSLQAKCLEVKCLMSSVYTGGECQQIAQKIGGVSFNVFLKMTPLQRLVISDSIEREIEAVTKIWLNELQLFHSVNTFRLYHREKGTFTSPGVREIWYFVAYFKLNLIPTYEEDYMADALSIDLLLTKHKTNMTIAPYFDDTETYTLFIELDTRDAIDHSAPEFDDHPTLLPVLFCPIIELDATFYQFKYSIIGVFIKKFDTEIERNAYMKTNDSSIVICRDTFTLLLERYKQTKQRKSDELAVQGNTPEGILSLVCSSVSILCSFITLIVYARVKSMHTQPGMNNMCLAVSLICAQTFFQYGIGQAKNIPSWACSLIGGLIHYFWIVAILWMNVCTYHMFKIFRRLQNLDFSRNLKRVTCLYCLYCSLVALVPVLTNMVVTYIIYGKLGYGGNLCYISDYRMVGFCFALPIAVVIVVNWFMFFATVYRISALPAVNTLRKEEKKFLVIYTKMSTLTGITWIFGFLFFFISLSVLEYLFIIFNAGQGVFLFLSFVCNKRVWKLLTESNKKESATLKTM